MLWRSLLHAASVLNHSARNRGAESTNCDEGSWSKCQATNRRTIRKLELYLSRKPIMKAVTLSIRESLQYRLGLRMGLVINLDQLFHRDVGVDLRRREASVAEQFLNITKIGAAVQQMRGKRMTQGVRADVVNAGAETNIFFHQPAD